MLINSETLVSMREANQNFSKVAHLVEEKGSVVIMKNNKPHFVLMSFDEVQAIQDEAVQDEPAQGDLDERTVMDLTRNFAARYHEALSELAK